MRRDSSFPCHDSRCRIEREATRDSLGKSTASASCYRPPSPSHTNSFNYAITLDQRDSWRKKKNLETAEMENGSTAMMAEMSQSAESVRRGPNILSVFLCSCQASHEGPTLLLSHDPSSRRLKRGKSSRYKRKHLYGCC